MKKFLLATILIASGIAYAQLDRHVLPPTGQDLNYCSDDGSVCLTIDGVTGNVGVGTDAPTAQLEVQSETDEKTGLAIKEDGGGLLFEVVEAPLNGKFSVVFQNTFGFFRINTNAAAKTCESWCSDPGIENTYGVFDDASGQCVHAWNSGTKTPIGCSDGAAITKECLCAGLK